MTVLEGLKSRYYTGIAFMKMLSLCGAATEIS
jgi:hypothetical protein